MDSDLIRGKVDTIILRCLANGEMYGNEIINYIKHASGNTYILNQQTLSSALKRLAQKGLIARYWKDSSIGGERHYNKLTDMGLNELNNKRNKWNDSKVLIDNLVQDNTFCVSCSNTQESQDKIDISIPAEISAEISPISPISSPAAAVEPIFLPEQDSRVVVTTRPVSPLEEFAAVAEYITVPLSNIQQPVLNSYVSCQADTAVKTDSSNADNNYNEILKTKIFDKPALVSAQPCPASSIMLKPFVKHASAKKNGKFILYNKLRLFCSFVVCGLLSAALVCSAQYLKASYTIEESAFFAIGWIAAAVYMLVNIARYTAYPKYKRLLTSPKADISRRFALTLCTAIAAVSLNIIAGLSSVNAADFLVYWTIPCILSTAFFLEGIAIMIFRKQSFFLT